MQRLFTNSGLPVSDIPRKTVVDYYPPAPPPVRAPTPSKPHEPAETCTDIVSAEPDMLSDFSIGEHEQLKTFSPQHGSQISVQLISPPHISSKDKTPESPTRKSPSVDLVKSIQDMMDGENIKNISQAVDEISQIINHDSAEKKETENTFSLFDILDDEFPSQTWNKDYVRPAKDEGPIADDVDIVQSVQDMVDACDISNISQAVDDIRQAMRQEPSKSSLLSLSDSAFPSLTWENQDYIPSVVKELSKPKLSLELLDVDDDFISMTEDVKEPIVKSDIVVRKKYISKPATKSDFAVRTKDDKEPVAKPGTAVRKNNDRKSIVQPVEEDIAWSLENVTDDEFPSLTTHIWEGNYLVENPAYAYNHTMYTPPQTSSSLLEIVDFSMYSGPHSDDYFTPAKDKNLSFSSDSSSSQDAPQRERPVKKPVPRVQVDSESSFNLVNILDVEFPSTDWEHNGSFGHSKEEMPIPSIATPDDSKECSLFNIGDDEFPSLEKHEWDDDYHVEDPDIAAKRRKRKETIAKCVEEDLQSSLEKLRDDDFPSLTTHIWDGDYLVENPEVAAKERDIAKRKPDVDDRKESVTPQPVEEDISASLQRLRDDDFPSLTTHVWDGNFLIENPEIIAKEREIVKPKSEDVRKESLAQPVSVEVISSSLRDLIDDDFPSLTTHIWDDVYLVENPALTEAKRGVDDLVKSSEEMQDTCGVDKLSKAVDELDKLIDHIPSSGKSLSSSSESSPQSSTETSRESSYESTTSSGSSKTSPSSSSTLSSRQRTKHSTESSSTSSSTITESSRTSSRVTSTTMLQLSTIPSSQERPRSTTPSLERRHRKYDRNIQALYRDSGPNDISMQTDDPKEYDLSIQTDATSHEVANEADFKTPCYDISLQTSDHTVSCQVCFDDEPTENIALQTSSKELCAPGKEVALQTDDFDIFAHKSGTDIGHQTSLEHLTFQSSNNNAISFDNQMISHACNKETISHIFCDLVGTQIFKQAGITRVDKITEATPETAFPLQLIDDSSEVSDVTTRAIDDVAPSAIGLRSIDTVKNSNWANEIFSRMSVEDFPSPPDSCAEDPMLTYDFKIRGQDDKIETSDEISIGTGDKLRTEDGKIMTENDKGDKLVTPDDIIDTKNEKIRTLDNKIVTDNKMKTTCGKSVTEDKAAETTNTSADYDRILIHLAVDGERYIMHTDEVFKKLGEIHNA